MAGQQPRVLVFGATGHQGGSVARFLLQDGGFSVRVASRNPNSQICKDLRSKGAQVVDTDLDNADSVARALENVDYVFLVTNYWAPDMTLEQEVDQGKRVTDLAKRAGIKHIVFSCLENVTAINDQLRAPLEHIYQRQNVLPHFDGKGIIKQYIIDSQIPATFIQLPFLFENLISLLPPDKEGDRTFVWKLNMHHYPLPGMAMQDIGGVVLSILRHTQDHQGKTYGLASESMPLDTYMEVLKQQFPNYEFRYKHVSTQTMAQRPIDGAKEIANMMQFYWDQKHCVRNPTITKRLYPQVMDFQTWVQNMGQTFITELEKAAAQGESRTQKEIPHFIRPSQMQSTLQT